MFKILIKTLVVLLATISQTAKAQSELFVDGDATITGRVRASQFGGIDIRGVGQPLFLPWWSLYVQEPERTGNPNIDQLSYAAFFDGATVATGTKSFLIPNPDRPSTSLIRHFCHEGNEPLNRYSGTAQFDADGIATVTLPDYFPLINRDARYQVTPLGMSMPDIFVVPLNDGDTSFQIKGGVSHGKVCWEITGIRNDEWVRFHGYEDELDIDESVINANRLSSGGDKINHDNYNAIKEKVFYVKTETTHEYMP